MTHREKAELLKDTIIFLYTKEGRSKSYISKLLNIDRKVLSVYIEELKLVKANVSHLKPSTQKFLNKHRTKIKSMLDRDISQSEIARELGCNRGLLITVIKYDSILSKANEDYIQRIHNTTEVNRNLAMEKSKLNYDFKDIEGEEWKPILGNEDYFISNKGRVKHYIKSYNNFALLRLNENMESHRMYIRIRDKNYQIARLVGFAFVDGYSEECNTIDHIDGNVTNNYSSNLCWVSQHENNLRAYRNGRVKNIAFSNHPKFRYILVDSKYEFKTVVALAKFLDVSPTQAYRYISGECNCSRRIEIIY